jgi:type IV pilus assembly protein PilN
MANINLLPWREERRQELKQAFLVVLGVVAAVGIALVILAHITVSSAVDKQASRNEYLQKQIHVQIWFDAYDCNQYLCLVKCIDPGDRP